LIKLSQKDLREKVEFAKRYMAGGNAASGSEVDPNANVSSKNVATLATEMNKDIDVQINRYALGEKIKELFGEADSVEYFRQLENHEIYSHDESAIYNKPYCVAIDLYPFINGGNRMLGGSSDAPEHLHSFCGGYVNLIFLIAGQFAGAVADVSFLTYFDYFARKDFGDDYLKTNPKQIENFLQQVIYTLNDPAVGRGYQAVFYNTSIFDENYFKAMFSSVIFPDFTSPRWDTVSQLQKFFMTWFNKERNRALLTFPVMTAAYVTENGTAKDVEFKKFLAKEMSEGNSFFIYSSDSVDSLSSCCRLKNKIEANVFAYTLGGTGISTGSKKVFTLNMNRLIQDKKDLREETAKLHKYLVAYDANLREMQAAGMLPVYDAGFIAMDKQYLTIGVNGMVEAAEFLGMDISNNETYKQWLIDTLSIIKAENERGSAAYTTADKKISFNTEFVPAESLGARFSKWDAKSGYKVPREVYNSYFYRVEDDEISIFDKFDLYAKEITDHLDGGSAYHMNIAELPTADTFELLLDYSTKVGCSYWTCSYWTFNCLTTCCENPACGYNDKNTTQLCAKCGSKDISYATRVIGYLKKIKSFSPERQREAGYRKYAFSLKENNAVV